MSPKSYFEKNFKNIQKFGKENYYNDELLSRNHSYEELEEVFNADNFIYSNNPEFETLINKFFGKTIYISDFKLYVGKLANAYPNCYAVKDSELEGCLICITSGMTENTYVLSKYYTLLYLYKDKCLKNEEFEMYKTVLENDIVRRIKEWYGSSILPGDLLYYADYIISKSNSKSLFTYAASFSYVMDLFLILHEYAHYLINTFEKNKDLKVIVLMLESIDLFVCLYEANPVFLDMPQEEVMADIMALNLMIGHSDLEMDDIMAIFLAVVQLNKMSLGDEYTNNYRLELFYFYFTKMSNFFCNNEQEIKGRVQIFLDFFDREYDKLFTDAELKKKSWEAIQNVIFASDDRNYVMDIITFIANDRIKGLQRFIDNSKKVDSDDEYEEFL